MVVCGLVCGFWLEGLSGCVGVCGGVRVRMCVCVCVCVRERERECERVREGESERVCVCVCGVHGDYHVEPADSEQPTERGGHGGRRGAVRIQPCSPHRL